MDERGKHDTRQAVKSLTLEAEERRLPEPGLSRGRIARVPLSRVAQRSIRWLESRCLPTEEILSRLVANHVGKNAGEGPAVHPLVLKT